MGEISLNEMHFYAHHGYYTHERKRGNNYNVDVHIEYDMELAAMQDDLDKAVNYEGVYACVKQEMFKPQSLIETVARNIALSIGDRFPDIEYLRVNLRKMNPELGGPVEYAEVVWEYPEG